VLDLIHIIFSNLMLSASTLWTYIAAMNFVGAKSFSAPAIIKSSICTRWLLHFC